MSTEAEHDHSVETKRAEAKSLKEALMAADRAAQCIEPLEEWKSATTTGRQRAVRITTQKQAAREATE